MVLVTFILQVGGQIISNKRRPKFSGKDFRDRRGKFAKENSEYIYMFGDGI